MPNYKKTIRIGWSFSLCDFAHVKIDRMDIKTRVIATWRTIRKQPPKVWFISGGILACIVYALVFFLPKPVAFSYAGETCVDQLVVAPGLQKSTSSEFDVSFKDELRIGSVVVASKKVCIIPTKTLHAGTYVLGVAPYGGFVARTHLSVAAHAAPTAKKDDLIGRAVSAARPLKLAFLSLIEFTSTAFW